MMRSCTVRGIVTDNGVYAPRWSLMNTDSPYVRPLSTSNEVRFRAQGIPALTVVWILTLCVHSAASATPTLETNLLLKPGTEVHTSLSDSPQNLSTRPSLQQRSLTYSRSELSSQPPITWSGSYGPLHLLDETSDYVPGQPVFRKPRIEFQFNAPTLRHTLLNIGVDAHRCTAPVIKFRGKLLSSGTTQMRGAMWVMARCSIW